MAIQLDPKYPDPYNDLAWLLATCSISTNRNGAEAVKLATSACKLTDWKKWYYVGTLAAAYAEIGDFDNAVKYQQDAIKLKPESAGDNFDEKQRLELYSKHQPYHESQN